MLTPNSFRSDTYQGSAGYIDRDHFELIGLRGDVHELVRSWPGGPQYNAAWKHLLRGLWPWLLLMALVGVGVLVGYEPDKTQGAILLIIVLATGQFTLTQMRRPMQRDQQAGVQSGQLTLEVQLQTWPVGLHRRVTYERGSPPTTIPALLGDTGRFYVTLVGLTPVEVSNIHWTLHERLGRQGTGDISSG